MDPRRLRHYADHSGRPAPQPRRSVDGFLAPSRSLPTVKLNHPARPIKPSPRPIVATSSRPRPVAQSLPVVPVRPIARNQTLPQRDWATTHSKTRSSHLNWRQVAVPLACLGLVVLSVIVWQRHGKATGQVESLQTHTSNQPAQKLATSVSLPTADGLAAYKSSIQSIFNNNPLVRATVITVNLKTGQKVQLGSSDPYTAASTAKLLTAVTYFLQIEKGTATLDQVMSNGQTAQYNLQQMVVQSDNDCWTVLNDYLTHTKLSQTASSIGMKAYDPDNNVLTANDIALLLQQLYDGTLINNTNRQMLLGWMEAANYRDDIVAAVPSGYTVYHKVGVVDDVLHDAAIITKDDEALELVVYTDGGGSYETDAREAMMHDITKAALAAYFKTDAN